MIVVTDAGRGGYKPKERNDCAVRAIAKVLRMSYRDAYKFLEAVGRKEDAGLPLMILLKDAWERRHPIRGKSLQFMHYNPDLPRYTAEEFRNAHRKGAYIVQVKEHVFALIDGIVYDDRKWPLEKDKVVSYCKFL